MQVSVLDLEELEDVAALGLALSPLQQYLPCYKKASRNEKCKHHCAIAWCQSTPLTTAAFVGPRTRWLWVPCVVCSGSHAAGHVDGLSIAVFSAGLERTAGRRTLQAPSAHYRGILHWVVGGDCTGKGLCHPWALMAVPWFGTLDHRSQFPPVPRG